MKPNILFSSLLLAAGVSAFIGFDLQINKPPCAHSCFRALSNYMLPCSIVHEGPGHVHDHGNTAMTSGECRARDTAWLTSLAYCVDQKCGADNIPLSALQLFWEESSNGDPAIQSKWDYVTTLGHISGTPKEEPVDEVLNTTTLFSEASWTANYGVVTIFTKFQFVTAKYGIAILVTGFATPIVLTVLGYLPFMTGTMDKLRHYLVYPSVIGTYHVRPLPFNLGNSPTIGHALFILFFLIITVVLTGVSIHSTQPHSFFTKYQEIMNLTMLRTGIYAFALLPLVILFAGRNNVLLWLTNWSHSTYILLHRWIARIFGLFTILHSILALMTYKDIGAYPVEEKLPYWIWGSVATVTVSIMLVLSGLYFRRAQYEIFIISHILLAIFTIVGSWYHIYYRFGLTWGFERWIYAAVAVWFFDRLMRVMRILKNGVRRARVTDVGAGHVRVDVQGIRWSSEPGRHCYAYFPTLKPLRPWENHPFSVMPTYMLRVGAEDVEKNVNGGKLELESSSVQSFSAPAGTAGLTFFIRKSAGLTQYLQTNPSLPILLDGPYPNNSTATIMACDRILLVGGGIGITGLLPWTQVHPNVKVSWSVKAADSALVEAIHPVLDTVADKDVRIGNRLDVGALLEDEAAKGWGKVGVVACGPGGLCDDVRAAVVSMRGKGVWLLQVDAYSW